MLVASRLAGCKRVAGIAGKHGNVSGLLVEDLVEGVNIQPGWIGQPDMIGGRIWLTQLVCIGADNWRTGGRAFEGL